MGTEYSSRPEAPTRRITPPRLQIAGRFLTLLLAALMGLAVPATAVWAAAPKPGDKEAELKQVRSRIDSIRRSIQTDAVKRDSLAGEVRNAELAVQTARERLSEVRRQRQASEKRLADLKTEHAQTTRRIAEERQALSDELTVAYMNGRQEQLKLLLNQQDPARLGRMLSYYGYFSRARAERITAISEHLAHLELVTESIAAETQKLQALEKDQERDVQALAGAREQRARTLAQVQASIKTRSGELARLNREAQALEKLLEELRRAIQDFPELAERPFQQVRGRLPWPIKGQLLARYGQPRAGGPLKWQGIVIAAQAGAQVRSPYYGRVVYADWLPGMGLLVVLDHGGGYMSLYGHNEQIYRRVGDRVKPGDPLSAVGDAAGFGKPGLYFEIRLRRQALDPAVWLSKP